MRIDLLPEDARRLLNGDLPRENVVLAYWREALDTPLPDMERRMTGATARVRESNVPNLIVAGRPYGAEYSTWLQRAVPGASVTLVPGSRHFPRSSATRTCPRRLLAETGRWLTFGRRSLLTCSAYNRSPSSSRFRRPPPGSRRSRRLARDADGGSVAVMSAAGDRRQLEGDPIPVSGGGGADESFPREGHYRGPEIAQPPHRDGGSVDPGRAAPRTGPRPAGQARRTGARAGGLTQMGRLSRPYQRQGDSVRAA
jgi:hypothetical protein